MNCNKTWLAAFLVLTSGGCALTGNYVLPGNTAAPQMVVLLQLPMLIEQESMSKLYAPTGVASESADSDRSIKNAVDHAERLAFSTLRYALQTRLGIEVDNSDAVLRAAHELKLDRESTIPPGEVIQHLRASTGADAILRFRITDYGVTPKSWRKAMIVFEVVSTLGIAAIAYAYPRTRPIAGIYLVEETIDEVASYYGGTWALEEVCRPVRIEAELILLKNGSVAWKRTSTGLSNIRLSRIVRDVGKAERDAQLDSALEAAANRIASDLAEALSLSRPTDVRATEEHGTHAVAF